MAARGVLAKKKAGADVPALIEPTMIIGSAQLHTLFSVQYVHQYDRHQESGADHQGVLRDLPGSPAVIEDKYKHADSSGIYYG